MKWLGRFICNNAEEVKTFYQRDIGWQVEEVSMGGYNDYAMTSAKTGEAIRVYVMQVVTKVKPMGSDRYAVIKDPAGAVCAIY